MKWCVGTRLSGNHIPNMKIGSVPRIRPRLTKKSKEAEAFFRRIGITFNVYGQSAAQERLIPFDLVPRILSNREWTKLSRGIEQRVRAINAFLHDIYNRQEILRAGRIPVDLISKNEAFSAADDRHDAARQCLYPYRRHRHRAHGRGRFFCSRRQCPHPVWRFLYVGKP